MDWGIWVGGFLGIEAIGVDLLLGGWNWCNLHGSLGQEFFRRL
jgi:hypothetical protein